MGQPSVVRSERISNGKLYAAALGALGRALMFYGQACALARNRSLAAIAAYYSLLHLSLCVCFMTVDRLSDKLRKKMIEVRQSWPDPARGLSHREVEEVLTDLAKNHGMPKLLLDSFRKAKKLREFLNYGPRMTFDSNDVMRFGTCEYKPEDVHSIVNSLRDCFTYVMQWMSVVGRTTGVALFQVDKIVRPSTGYYAPLVPGAALWRSARLRKHLISAIRRGRAKNRTRRGPVSKTT